MTNNFPCESPVPADDNLPEGLEPFTNFGQFGYGKMDNRVFEQDVYWVDIKGEPHMIEEMSSDYRINVIMFLRDNNDYFFHATFLRKATEVVCSALEGETHSELFPWLVGGDTIFDLTPKEWLESTPLMRKLLRLEYSN
jgi:hypothetical protein